MITSTVDKNNLIELGFKPNQAVNVIRQAKQIMVKRGYPFYNNKRVGRVPRKTVEEILGISLTGETQSV